MLFFLYTFAYARAFGDFQGLRVLKTLEMGKGLFVSEGRVVDAGEKILCVNETEAIHSDDPNFLLEHVLGVSDIERLKAYLLYHRFVLKEKSKVFGYFEFIGKNEEHPVYYSEGDLESLGRVAGYFDMDGIKDLKKNFKVLAGIFGKLKSLPKEMMTFESYLWASELVMSRSFISFNSETKDYSYIFLPYIDLANYWPIKPSTRYSSELFYESGQYCLISSKALQPGDQVFIDYSFVDLSKFFCNFGFVVERDPKLSIAFHLLIDPCKNCTYALKHFEVNWELYQKILQLTESDFNPEVNIRDLMQVVKDSYMYNDLIMGLLIYRFEMIGMKKSIKLGLRELRRQVLEASGRNRKILEYGVAFRVLVYTHIESIERELVYGLYSYLF